MRKSLLLFWSVPWALAATAQELPSGSAPGRLEFEPDLILTEPGKAVSDAAPGSPGSDIPKMEAALERAKRTAASFQRLFKSGAAAKVEVERSEMRVTTIAKDIAVAKAHIAQAELEELRAKVAPEEATAAALKAAEEAAQALDAAARQEIATWQKAQLDAAVLNLSRWQKLLALGAARKIDVAHAQEQLAALQRTQQVVP